MDSSPSVETVCQAIHTLYTNPDPNGKEKASVWLGELQKSIYSWKIADELLLKKVDVVTCCFAAQTMRTKIQYAFHELPSTAYDSLRDSLLFHIDHINQETNQAIITQLCLSLADLALQMATWKGATQDLILRYGEKHDQIPALLEILTVMPEEINSRSLRLGANRRSEMMDEFNKGAPLVLQLLNLYIERFVSDPRVLVRVMRCLGSWFNIGVIPATDVEHSKLLASVFYSLMDPQTPAMVHEAATDCVCAALLLVEDLEKHAGLARALYVGILSLRESYHMSVAEEDTDKSINYCRVFTELAESFLDTVINHSGQSIADLEVLDVLLTCVGHHDYEVAEITFNCWYRLSEDLYKKNNDHYNETFKPYIERLITALCKHCQLEPDHDDSPDEGDDFYDFRVRVSELIKDVVFLVGSSNCFRQMFNNLKCQSNSTTWDICEASLFVMMAVAKNILPDEDEVVPQVVDAILNLPDNTHVAVRYTSTQLIGELSEWIERHPQTLEPVLNFLSTCMSNKKLSTVAANALQNISSTCRDRMGAHFQGLLQIIELMDNFSISNEAAVGLLKGAALILSTMASDKMIEGLKQICLIQLTPLSQIIQSTETNRGDPTVWLDRLAAIFRHLNIVVTNGQVHPCQALVQEIWPLLSDTCNNFQSDIRIIERCCRCIRFAVRCIGKQSAPLLEPLVKQMIQLYQVHQHSCYLYLGSILVDEYGSESGCMAGLLNMLHAFCGPTFKLLETNGLRAHPDTVDDLFRLCTRFVQKAPILLLQSVAVKPIVSCALVACMVDHRDANSSVMKFLLDLLKCGRNKDEEEDFAVRRSLVSDLLNEHGQTLMTNAINACIFCLPSYMVPDIAEVIYEMMVLDRPSVCRWLEVTLKALPTQQTGGNITATQKQLTDFHKAVTSAENMKMVRNSIHDFIRLFR